MKEWNALTSVHLNILCSYPGSVLSTINLYGDLKNNIVQHVGNFVYVFYVFRKSDSHGYVFRENFLS